MTRVADVLHALYSSCEGVIEFRAFNVNGITGRLFAALEDADTIRAFWVKHKADNLYWGIATRRDDRDGTLANCLHLPALFADLDFKLSSEAAIRAALAAFPLPPSLVVLSGGGLQPYWLLREPADVQQECVALRDVLRRLACRLAGDVVAGEPARVLRVPGTLNAKYTPPRVVRVEEFKPDRQYNISEFDFLPAEPIRSAAQPINLSKTIGELRNQTLYRLARALKGKHFPDAMIAATIRHVNIACCAPPLEDAEMTQVIRNALTQPDRPHGGAPAVQRIRVEVA